MRWPPTGNTARRCRWKKSSSILTDESGKAFDPRVVNVLQNRYRELEKLVSATVRQEQEKSKLSTEVKMERGNAPDAGFESSNTGKEGQEPTSFLPSRPRGRKRKRCLS